MSPKLSDEPFARSMSLMRRHLHDCYECRAAMNQGWDSQLCTIGARMAVQVAANATKVLEMKRIAAVNRADVVYLCPDLAKHGESYAMSAVPFKASGVQGELF